MLVWIEGNLRMLVRHHHILILKIKDLLMLDLRYCRINFVQINLICTVV